MFPWCVASPPAGVLQPAAPFGVRLLPALAWAGCYRACGKAATKSKCTCGACDLKYDGLLMHDLRRTGMPRPTTAHSHIGREAAEHLKVSQNDLASRSILL
jgi:hypothetical protein